MLLAAALGASVGAAGAASADTAAAYTNAHEVCAVYGSTVDPRFCADYVSPAARWVDPLETGGVETGEHIVAPNAGGHVMPWKATADGLLVEVITP